jgi:hypothetical protein
MICSFSPFHRSGSNSIVALPVGGIRGFQLSIVREADPEEGRLLHLRPTWGNRVWNAFGELANCQDIWQQAPCCG